MEPRHLESSHSLCGHMRVRRLAKRSWAQCQLDLPSRQVCRLGTSLWKVKQHAILLVIGCSDLRKMYQRSTRLMRHRKAMKSCCENLMKLDPSCEMPSGQRPMAL